MPSKLSKVENKQNVQYRGRGASYLYVNMKKNRMEQTVNIWTSATSKVVTMCLTYERAWKRERSLKSRSNLNDRNTKTFHL